MKKYQFDLKESNNKVAGLNDFKDDIKNNLVEYSSLHTKLKCCNLAHYCARKVALSVGLRDIHGLRDSLVGLKFMVDDETFVDIASIYELNYDIKNLRPEDKLDALFVKMQLELSNSPVSSRSNMKMNLK